MSDTPQGQIVTMPGRRGLYVLDARGEPVRIINLEHPKQVFPWWADVPVRDQRRVIEHVPGLRVRRIGRFIGCIALGALFGSVLTIGLRGLLWPALPGTISPILILLMCAASFVRLIPNVSLSPKAVHQSVSGFLLNRLCPVCTHSLESLPTGADGCTVCPECGSAWRLNAPEVEQRAAST